MSNAFIKNLLADLSIFHNLSEEEYRILAFIGTRQRFNAHEYLYSANDYSQNTLLMVAGRAKFVFIDTNKKDVIAKRGDLLNELSLFSEKDYDFDIIALENITVLSFDRDDFLRLMEEFPEIGHKIQSNIALRLQKFSQALNV